MRLIKKISFILKTLFSLFLVFFSSFLFAQDAPIAIISSITNATPGSSLLSIPVRVNNFNNIGQFTLTMKFDTTKVRFVSAIPNSLLSGMTITYSSPVVGNTFAKLIFTWTGSSNQSLSDGSALANLSFSYITATGIISWAYANGQICQYKTYVGTTLTPLNDSPQYLFYLNGGISNRSAPSVFAPNIPSPAIGPLPIPLIVNNFSGIGGLTLYIEYDTTVIKYQNTFTKNAVFNSSFLVGNNATTGSKKQIVIQWYGTALSLTNGATLCTLNFTYLAGGNTTDLKFYDIGPSCEYADGSGNVLIDMPTVNYYSNGKIGTDVKIKGQLTYDNSVSTPLNGFTIKLIDSANVVVATTTTATYTDNSIPGIPVVKGGYYEFPNIYNKNYSLRINSSMSWGGVNSTDVLCVLRHTLGLEYLSNLSLVAADANLSKAINSTDALLVQLRTVGSINQFQAGDWVYSDTNVSVNGITTHDFKALATGDVNQSYIPITSKDAVYTKILKEGIIYSAKNEVVELPIKVNDFLNLGAVTLEIIYDTNLIEVMGLNSKLNDLKYNISNGKIRIAWSDCSGVSFQINDVLFILNIKLKASINSSTDLFSYTNNSEFADVNGHIINFNNLKTCNIETNNNQGSFCIFPNPFSDKIIINYKLPFEGMVKLKLYNYTGSCVIEQVNEIQHKGNHSLNLDVSNLAFGIYMATLSLKNGENEFFKIIKIVK